MITAFFGYWVSLKRLKNKIAEVLRLKKRFQLLEFNIFFFYKFFSEDAIDFSTLSCSVFELGKPDYSAVLFFVAISCNVPERRVDADDIGEMVLRNRGKGRFDELVVNPGGENVPGFEVRFFGFPVPAGQT